MCSQIQKFYLLRLMCWSLFLVSIGMNFSHSVVSAQTGPREFPPPEDYQPGVVRIRLSTDAVRRDAFRLKDGIRSADRTGLQAIDSILFEFDMQEVSARAVRPKDTALAALLGLDRDFLIRVDESADIPRIINKLSALPFIERAFVNMYAIYTAVPNDPLYSKNWGHDNQSQHLSHGPGCNAYFGLGPAVGALDFDADADSAWDKPSGYGDTSIIIAILDSGVDDDHPDIRQVQGENCVNPGQSTDDDLGHGTNCAGVAAAIADNGIGVAGIAGGCSIMPIKISVFPDPPTANGVEDGLIYAADNGADVASMSFVMILFDPQAVEDAVEYAYTKGVVLFASTGNNHVAPQQCGLFGNNRDILYWPAKLPEVIAIGSASPCGERKRDTDHALVVTCDNEIWWGSNSGTGIDFLAPTILPTTDIQGTGGRNTDPGTAGDYFLWFGGTSCSSPYAAGVAALILSEDPTLTPSEVKQRMIDGAIDITIPASEASVGYDTVSGYGLVNAYHSLNALTVTVPTTVLYHSNCYQLCT
ncbi:MAG: S8 family serine peptidase [candidate division Zixibacteria bacterium]|nr:S8 family serine peptidase [candidate division Zixibacteria bacterium]